MFQVAGASGTPVLCKFCVRVEEVIWGARREKKRKKKREKG
jgi:hypothetical protein